MPDMELRFECRINQDTEDKINFLMNKYKDDYPSKAAILRAGVHSLLRWKKDHAVLYPDYDLVDSKGEDI